MSCSSPSIRPYHYTMSCLMNMALPTNVSVTCTPRCKCISCNCYPFIPPLVQENHRVKTIPTTWVCVSSYKWIHNHSYKGLYSQLMVVINDVIPFHVIYQQAWLCHRLCPVKSHSITMFDVVLLIIELPMFWATICWEGLHVTRWRKLVRSNSRGTSILVVTHGRGRRGPLNKLVR